MVGFELNFAAFFLVHVDDLRVDFAPDEAALELQAHSVVHEVLHRRVGGAGRHLAYLARHPVQRHALRPLLTSLPALVLLRNLRVRYVVVVGDVGIGSCVVERSVI